MYTKIYLISFAPASRSRTSIGALFFLFGSDVVFLGGAVCDVVGWEMQVQELSLAFPVDIQWDCWWHIPGEVPDVEDISTASCLNAFPAPPSRLLPVQQSRDCTWWSLVLLEPLASAVLGPWIMTWYPEMYNPLSLSLALNHKYIYIYRIYFHMAGFWFFFLPKSSIRLNRETAVDY